MHAPKKRFSYQLHIQLQDFKPAIWRRVLVADTTSLAELHQIIQAAMGGLIGQRFALEIATQRYGNPNPDQPDDPTMDARRYTLHQLLQGQSLPIRYYAGLAGGLQHRIKLEACTPSDAQELRQLPLCLDGRSPCPPLSHALSGNCFDLPAAQKRVQALSATALASAGKPSIGAAFLKASPTTASAKRTFEPLSL